MEGDSTAGVSAMQQEDGDVIDESLYSRQLYVLGEEAMKKMTHTAVLVVGADGLGVEIAKNVILAGVKSLTVHDNEVATMSDLAAQFYLSERTIGENRALACVKELAELNQYVRVRSHTGELEEEFLREFQVILMANQKTSDQLRLGDWCHRNGVHFIAVEARGVFGYVFVDLGDSFVVSDVNGENPATAMIASITQENPGVVTTLDEARHGLESGDHVTFDEVEGMTELNGSVPRPIQVLGPYTFSIEDTHDYTEYTRGGIVRQVKMPMKMCFHSICEAIEQPAFLITDFGKCERPAQLHLGFQALDSFVTQHGTYPQPGNREHAAEVLSLAREINSRTACKVDKVDADLLTWLALGSSAVLAPMTATLGGIAAQEVLKACSGKFTPINQYLYFDATECLPPTPLPPEEYHPLGCRYDGQIAVFGRTYQEKIKNLKYFLVGAGAIGCEVLKIWALMGVGCGDHGFVYVTDMDSIEKTNLNRQFLFRPWDVQKLKSLVAVETTRKMNPDIRIKALTEKVGPETEEVFNDDFYEALDGVCAALDNVQARLYLDQRCVFYCKPMLESGTLGTKCHTQVIVPYLTESYGSSRDPPEKQIPICTLKNFPNAIEHCIQWARDHFEGIFRQQAEEVNSYLSNPGFVDSLGPGTKMATLEALKECLVTAKPLTFDECIVWARLKFEELFFNQIKQLLFSFPEDMVSQAGVPFWSGPKRCPQALVFNPEDPTHMDFVMTAAGLRALGYGLKAHNNMDEFKHVLSTVVVPEFVPRTGVKIQVTEGEEEAQPPSLDDDGECARLVAELPPPSALAGYRMNAIEFEKDDDTNGHIAFITAASNLRARNYRINEADRQQTKLIAGKIIPAIATTTALACGLMSLEQYKLHREGTPLEMYKNGFANLALPFFGFSEPIPPPSKPLKDGSWTLWDRFDVEGDLPLKDFLEHFKTRHNLEISMISSGVSILYSDFMMTKAKLEERLPMRITEIIETVTKQSLNPTSKYIILEICCLDESGEDVDTPYVRLKLR